MNRSPRFLRRVVIVVVSASVVGATLLPAAVGAEPPIDESEGVQAAQNEVDRVLEQLDQLHQESDILAERYVVAVNEQAQLEADVADAEVRVAEKEAEVGGLRTELSEVAVQSFTSAGANGLGPMFSDSTEFTDTLQRDQLSRVALSTGTATTDELDQAVSDLTDERAELDRLREEATEKAAETEAAQAANEEQLAAYQEARAEAEANLQIEIEEEEERRARESYERMQREAEAAAAAALQQQQEAASQAQQQANAAASSSSSSSSSSSRGNALAAPQTPVDTSGSESSGGSGDSGSGNSGTSGSSGSGTSGSDSSGSGSGSGGSSSGGGSTPNIPPASSKAGTAVNAAMSQIGVPYRYAAATPGVAFDCSGLTSWAWGQAGVYLPHQSAQQYASLPKVPASSAQPGDLIFFYSPISHVSMYIGGGTQVHAPNTGSTVTTASVNWGRVVGVARPG
jgi:cell wall-associated NlpC family hydrolase